MTTLQGGELGAWIQCVCALTGIDLDESKAYLIENRLAPVLQSEGCASFGELLQRVQADREGALRRKVIDAITTGETQFFRDQAPYEALRFKILPDLIDRRCRAVGRRAGDGRARLPIGVRVWSAACSTGQEVYSIAIVLRETLAEAGANVHVVATDISDRAVARASYGAYTTLEIERGLPPAMRDRWFSRHGDGWRVRDELRAMVSFKTLSLMGDFSSLGRFDIVFCRNVAIYFRQEARASLFARIARALEPDGYLIIGATESIGNVCTELESRRYQRTVFYQPRGG